MRQVRFTILLVSVFLLISPSSLLAVTIWRAAEHFDDLVDDGGDDVEAVVFEGKDALTGGGIYFLEEIPVQAITDTTYFEYDLGECPEEADGEVWHAWGRFEWTGGIGGCNSFALIWFSDGIWRPGVRFGDSTPTKRPWHWKDTKDSVTLPALSTGDPIKIRIAERESQDVEDKTPWLDVFCFTTDPEYIPVDEDVPEFKSESVDARGKSTITWGQIKDVR